MKAADIERINQARANRASIALLMNEAQGVIRLVDEVDFADDPLAVHLIEFARKAISGWVGEGEARVFCRLYVPKARLVVIGAVHIAQALAELNKAIGFDLEIIDPRAAFASRVRFANDRLLCGWPDQLLLEQKHRLDRYSALITLSHDPKIDDPGLIMALRSDCFYIGALGSRKTHAKRIQRLVDAGFSDEDIARIEAPVGLDIGSVGPEEIALSVMASVVKHHRQRL